MAAFIWLGFIDIKYNKFVITYHRQTGALEQKKEAEKIDSRETEAMALVAAKATNREKRMRKNNNEDDEKLRTWGFFVILFIFELIRMQWHIIMALIAQAIPVRTVNRSRHTHPDTDRKRKMRQVRAIFIYFDVYVFAIQISYYFIRSDFYYVFISYFWMLRLDWKRRARHHLTLLLISLFVAPFQTFEQISFDDCRNERAQTNDSQRAYRDTLRVWEIWRAKKGHELLPSSHIKYIWLKSIS